MCQLVVGAKQIKKKGKIMEITSIKPELLVTLVNSRVFQVMLLLHVFQQVLHIRVLFLTEAAVLLHLQVDALYVDLR